MKASKLFFGLILAFATTASAGPGQIGSANSGASNFVITQQHLRMLNSYNIEFIIGKTMNEAPSETVKFRDFQGENLIVNAYFESAPQHCYQVKLGEKQFESKTILRVVDFKRDLSCDQ